MTPDEKASAKRFNEGLKVAVATANNAGLAIMTGATAAILLEGGSVRQIYWEFIGFMIIVVSIALFEQMKPEE